MLITRHTKLALSLFGFCAISHNGYAYGEYDNLFTAAAIGASATALTFLGFKINNHYTHKNFDKSLTEHEKTMDNLHSSGCANWARASQNLEYNNKTEHLESLHTALSQGIISESSIQKHQAQLTQAQKTANNIVTKYQSDTSKKEFVNRAKNLKTHISIFQEPLDKLSQNLKEQKSYFADQQDCHKIEKEFEEERQVLRGNTTPSYCTQSPVLQYKDYCTPSAPPVYEIRQEPNISNALYRIANQKIRTANLHFLALYKESLDLNKNKLEKIHNSLMAKKCPAYNSLLDKIQGITDDLNVITHYVSDHGSYQTHVINYRIHQNEEENAHERVAARLEAERRQKVAEAQQQQVININSRRIAADEERIHLDRQQLAIDRESLSKYWLTHKLVETRLNQLRRDRYPSNSLEEYMRQRAIRELEFVYQQTNSTTQVSSINITVNL